MLVVAERLRNSLFFQANPITKKQILHFKKTMKKFSITLAALAATVIAAHAQTTIASWDFEPDPLIVNLTNTTFPSSGSYAADNGGTGFLTAGHASASTAWSSPSGNGSSNSLSANNWAIGDYIQFQFSTLTLSNIGITWSHFRSSTGPANFSLSYSTDGSAFTSFTNYAPSTNTWSSVSNNIASVFTADLTSITLIDNQADVYFRLVAGSAPSASSGTSRIDDVTISVVPEPSTYAMLALAGAGFAGYVIRRRRR